MPTPQDIELAIRPVVPFELHDQLPPLAQTLADVVNGVLDPNDAEAQLKDLLFTPLLQALAGQQIEVHGSKLSFGQDNDAGKVSIVNGIDSMRITFTVVSTTGGDYAEGTIDKRQGTFFKDVKVFIGGMGMASHRISISMRNYVTKLETVV